MKRKIILIIAAAAIVALTVAASAYSISNYLETERKFTKEKWTFAPASARMLVVEDLMENHLVEGSKSEDVTLLLGKADHTVTDGDMTVLAYRLKSSPISKTLYLMLEFRDGVLVGANTETANESSFGKTASEAGE